MRLLALLALLVLTPVAARAQREPPIDRALDVAVGDAIRGYAGCLTRQTGPVLCWSGPNLLHETARYFGAPTGPRAQPGTDGVVRVVRGADLLCGLHRDGRVLCWRSSYRAPVEAPVRDATELAMGLAQGCATRRDGSIACFDASSLPPYLAPTAALPVVRAHPAPSVRDLRGLAIGAGMGCGITQAGGVACWALETGSALTVPAILTPGPNGAALLAHGGAVACVIDVAGAILCRTGGSSPETRFSELGGAGIVHADVDGSTACAVSADGRLACWGPRPRRYTITGAEEAQRLAAPTQPAWIVAGLTDALRVDVTATHICVLTRSGHVRCFGPNESGELGDGTTTDRASPSFVVRHDVLPDPPHRPYGCRATLAQRRACPARGDDCVLEPVPGGWDLGPGGGAYCDEACVVRHQLALSALPVPACECSCDPAVLARRRGPARPPPPNVPGAVSMPGPGPDEIPSAPQSAPSPP